MKGRQLGIQVQAQSISCLSVMWPMNLCVLELAPLAVISDGGQFDSNSVHHRGRTRFNFVCSFIAIFKWRGIKVQNLEMVICTSSGGMSILLSSLLLIYKSLWALIILYCSCIFLLLKRETRARKNPVVLFQEGCIICTGSLQLLPFYLRMMRFKIYTNIFL